MKTRILFITQDLARTGSEMVLWYLLINLNKEKYAISVFCIRKGELYDILPEYIEKNIMYKSSAKRSDRIFRRLLKLCGIHPLKYQLDHIQKQFKADIWYVNTIAVPEVFELAKHKDVKMITHIHEYLYAFSEIKGQTLQRAISYSDVIIGCSEMVCEKIDNFEQTDVELQNSFIDTDTIHTDPVRIAAIKEKLGILSTDKVWVVSGGTKFMKGLDQVLPILEHFKHEPVKIIWLGAQLSNALEFYVRTVAEKKYPNKLIFAGAQSTDYYNYMSAANGLLLLSREETFSLVMVEASYLGLPVVAFDIGIAKKFLQEDMGIVVENCNLDQLIIGMKKVHENEQDYNEVSMRNAAMVYSAKHQQPIYEQLLNKITQNLLTQNKS